MVSTRGHPTNFPPPEDASPVKASPTKRRTRQSQESTPNPNESFSPDTAVVKRGRAQSVSTTWSHTPSTVTLVWLMISLPLVIWDTGYVLGRPHTMPGGKLHYPIWAPYAIYGSVDYFYGWPAIEANDGFTAAQGILNVAETVMYLVYLYIVYAYGVQEADKSGRGAPNRILGRRKVVGKEAGLAVLIGFSTCVMTISKTALYWLNEACTGFHHIGHNDWFTLVWAWIIPNGAWIVFPTYIGYVLGAEILQGLEIAAGLPYKKNQ